MPTTGKFNFIQLGSLYFTKDGLSTGTPCQSKVTGLDALLLTRTGRVDTAIDGTPYTQYAGTKGAPVSIEIESMEQAVYQSVLAIIQAAMDSGSAISMNVTGTLGTFRLSVVPALPEAVRLSGAFQNTRIKNVAFSFIVSAVHRTIAPVSGSYAVSGSAVTLTH